MQEKADLGKGSVTYPFPVFETEKRGKTLNYTLVQRHCFSDGDTPHNRASAIGFYFCFLGQANFGRIRMSRGMID